MEIILNNPEFYRHHVGPIEAFDSFGEERFQFLLKNGLKPNHKFLDIGCGALRIGKYLINYLKNNHYFGIDPAKNIVEIAYEKEIKQKLKFPEFLYNSEFNFKDFQTKFDFVLANDIFIHCGQNQFKNCLINLYKITKLKTKIFISVKLANNYLEEISNWKYQHSSHGNINYNINELKQLTLNYGFKTKIIEGGIPDGFSRTTISLEKSCLI